MLDLHSLSSIPRRAAALLVFAGPALALWAGLPAFDEDDAQNRARLSAEAGQACSLDDFSRDRSLISATARRHHRSLAPCTEPQKRAVQIGELHRLYTIDLFVANLDSGYRQEWHRGNFVRAIGLKLAVFKNLLLHAAFRALRGPRGDVLHASIASAFLLSGLCLFRLTRHA